MLALLVPYLGPPARNAVIVWLPTAKADVVNVALPVESTVTVARMTLPSMNATVPGGIPELGATALTMAVNVTDWPTTDELAELVKVVLVVAVLTVWVICPLLAVKFVAPP
jgi:hypothetical protein